MKRMTHLHLQVFNVYGYDRFYQTVFSSDRFFSPTVLPTKVYT